MTLPILDNHMHLNPKGRCIEAIKEFKRAGGTHVILVSLPSWSIDIEIRAPEDYRLVFEKTLKIARKIEETGIRAFTVLGVHPAEIDRLSSRFGLEKAVEIMTGGLAIACEMYADGECVGIKSGRPHYPVTDDVWNASNMVMRRSFELASEAGCAVQLHTESATKETLTGISSMAREAGMPLHQVVKHFSPPLVLECEKLGIFPSVLAGSGAIETALSEGTRFMMETDYIDDPERPGAVLGPKTVPKRTMKLMEVWGEDIFWKIHKENPEKVYGIEIQCPVF